MEVEGNIAASVEDASFLKKDAVVDEKLNNAVETIAANATEKVETIKKSEADCSSTVECSGLGKATEEKDDLLEQIEEVCNDKTLDAKNAEEISNTSEHEFLKKIEELEKNDVQTRPVASEKTKNVTEELKSKNILECEASTVDAVVVGDKVIEVKEDSESESCNQSSSATSSQDIKKSSSLANEMLEEKCESTTNCEMTNKDATVSSSTSKSVQDPTTVQDKSISEAIIQQVESTGTDNLTDEEEKTVEPMESKIIDLEEAAEEKMEVDNVKSEIMEVDTKESSSDDNVDMVSVETDNEATSKLDATSKNVSASKATEVTATTSEKGGSTSKDHSIDSKPLTKEIVETICEPPQPVSEVIANHKVEEKAEKNLIVEITKPENKPLLDLKLKENIVSSSLTNTPVSSSNVFNSTPIQKQFEISSENVSKISNDAELSHTEKDEEATSTKPLAKSFEDSTTESGTCATSETDQPSSDGAMKKYIDAIKKYNGMPDTTTDEEDTTTPAKVQKHSEKFEINICHLSGTDLKKDSTYEVNVCCDQNDVRYLSIERVDVGSKKNKSQEAKVLTPESSVQSSSNGSVISLPPYSLPQKVETPTSASTSSSTNCHSMTTSQDKHTIVGIEELCNFMINQFTKIKHAINPESAKAAVPGGVDMLTPTQQIKRNRKISPIVETPSTSASKSKRARKRSVQEDDNEGTPKTKHAKRDVSKETPKGDETSDGVETKTGPCVLAKWVDKKFYAGKITAEKAGNKYVVLFEDGASKTLPKESIVFGESDVLPLQDQQIYALVEEDYEIGTVLSIDKSSIPVVYAVKTENTTVKVTASDIYLEVDQAKEIQKIQNTKVGDGGEEEESFGSRPSRNKRPPASPSTPEAGYSGAVGKRGGKRQKRYS